jgi:hypothetical protein
VLHAAVCVRQTARVSFAENGTTEFEISLVGEQSGRRSVCRRIVQVGEVSVGELSRSEKCLSENCPGRRKVQVGELSKSEKRPGACHCSLEDSSSTPNYVFSITPSPSATELVGEQSIDGLLHEFPLIFEPGLGHCTKVKAHLELKKDAQPRFIRARPLPFAVYDTVDKEIDRWEQQGILQPVSHSAWAAPIVIAPKPGGQIRLCADFSTGLNQAINIH